MKILPSVRTPLMGARKQHNSTCGSAEGRSSETLPAASAVFFKPSKPLIRVYDQYYQTHYALGTDYSEVASNVNMPYNSFLI